MQWFIIIIAVIYSLIRYAWAKSIPVVNWPAFVGNKAMAFCAVCFLLTAIYRRKSNREESQKFFRFTLIAAISHGAMSAALLNPEYFKYLYLPESSKFNVFGEMTLLFGSLALGFFLTSSKETTKSFSWELTTLLVTLCHIISVGVLKWIDPARWTYGLVPISMLSCMIVISTITFSWKQKNFSSAKTLS